MGKCGNMEISVFFGGYGRIGEISHGPDFGLYGSKFEGEVEGWGGGGGGEVPGTMIFLFSSYLQSTETETNVYLYNALSKF